MERRLGRGVEQETVPVGARLVAAVGRDDEQRRQGVLQLLAHLGDGLAVAPAAVVHGLPWDQRQARGAFLKKQRGAAEKAAAEEKGDANTPTNLTFHTRWGSSRLSGLKELILAHIWPNTDLVPSGPASPPLLRERFTCAAAPKKNKEEEI